MNASTTLGQQAADKLDHGLSMASRTADRLTDGLDGALDSTQRRASQALDALSDGVDELRSAVPLALHRAEGQATAMSERALRSARHAREAALQGADRLGRQTRGYIREEPLKSVLLAAAAGALVAGLAALLRPRR